jgi:hypothetical protein
MNIPLYETVKATIEGVQAEFDLLRIKTACRLYEIENGTHAKSIDDVVPKYLATAPVDSFAPDGRTYSMTPVPHSVGPDGIDQQGTLLYDPNVSELGDLFLPPSRY